MIELDERELQTLILCSFRYALERTTGISYEISTFIIRYRDYLDDWVKSQIKRDIKHRMNAYGFELMSDFENWNDVLDKLK